jgi:hypothetical protein
MGSVVIGGQRPLDGLAGGPVVPDGGGHGQQRLGDAVSAGTGRALHQYSELLSRREPAGPFLNLEA